VKVGKINVDSSMKRRGQSFGKKGFSKIHSFGFHLKKPGAGNLQVVY
jgi:hypothetical protein